MTDEDTVIDELQAEPIETDSKPIEDLLQAIQDKNFTQAERQFNDLIGDRLQDTLDQAKARIASSLGSEEETEDESDEEELALDDLDLDVGEDDIEDEVIDDDDDEDDLVAPV